MNWYRFCGSASLVVAGALLGGCRQKPAGEHSTTGPALAEPDVPAGYRKIAPLPAESSAQMLGQTATVFRGVLKNVQFKFDPCGGPRTNYVFSDASPLMGTKVDTEVTVKALGGPTPSGTWVTVSELPQLALDSQYVVFLRNTDWTFSPIVGDLVFRVETVAGREMMIHPSGRAVTGWGEAGPLLSAGLVSEAVGGQLRGYRSAEAPAPADQPNSATTNSSGEVRPADGPAPAPAPRQSGGSLLDRAPSLAEMQRAGLFAKPALLAGALGNEQTATVDLFLSSVRTAADRAQVKIGGRVTLDPNWKCWSSTPTARVAR